MPSGCSSSGIDRVLNRRVSIRVNIYTDEPTRAWFLREAEALAQLDHPAIRHVYDVGVVGEVAYRVGNWIDGESLEHAAQRGPRLIPTVHTLARDLLSALEHAHTQGILFRRIVPAGHRAEPRRVAAPSPTCASAAGHCLPCRRACDRPDSASWRRRCGTGNRVNRRATSTPPGPCSTMPPPAPSRHSTPRPSRRPSELASRPRRARSSASSCARCAPNPAGATSPPGRCWRTSRRRRAPSRRCRCDRRARSSTPRADHAEEWEKLLRRALGDDYELLDTVGTRRVRPGLPCARPAPRAGSGAQGAASGADARPRRRRALPPRGAARREAAAPERGGHLRHPVTLGPALVHDGTGARAQPGAAGAA